MDLNNMVFSANPIRWFVYIFLKKVETAAYCIYALLLQLGFFQVVAFLSYAESFPALTDTLVDLRLWHIRDSELHNLVNIKVV